MYLQILLIRVVDDFLLDFIKVSVIFLTSLRRSSSTSTSTLAPPIPAEPAAVPVPVIEQESVLDLSVPTNPANKSCR